MFERVFSKKVIFLLSMTTVTVGSVAVGGTQAYAAVSPNVSSIANAIVTRSNEVNTLGQYDRQLLTTIQSSTFNWNEVMFGTGTAQLDSAQQATSTALLSSIQRIADFTITDPSTATSVINDVVSEMQGLNPAIPSSDVLSFLAYLESQSLSSLALSLLSQSGTSGSTYDENLASALHTDFIGYLSNSAPAIQSLFQQGAQPVTQVGGGGTLGGTAPAGGLGQVPGAGTVPGTTPAPGNTSTLPQTPGSTLGTTTGQGNSASSVLDKVFSVVTKSAIPIGPEGGAISVTDGNHYFNFTVPKGTFDKSGEIDVVTPSSSSGLSPFLPAGFSSEASFGIRFSQGTPSQPLTLTLTDPSIHPNSRVYQLASSGLVPVTAAVSNGQVVMTVNSSPNLVVLSPVKVDKSLTPVQRVIVLGNQQAVVPGLIHNNTTYMPVWYVMHELNSLGFNSTWNGHSWDLTSTANTLSATPASSVGTGNTGLYVDGKLIQKVISVASKDPSTSQLTTYMPIYNVMQILNRVGVQSFWDGTQWSLLQVK
ncbi:hypothetical protein LLE49_19025 [Alicyclobacillus tolerans]|uniref:hypothetical protein n=1 Tax=Alicyclobacillus tolerans TaxID=90970 RepID=UPI001F1E95BE|nr:hypothetical protein [Alicyclobacillus tolerans]MCF8566818.1 hypothetical protein [Alicyclobacillus tolerans]